MFNMVSAYIDGMSIWTIVGLLCMSNGLFVLDLICSLL